MSDERERPRQLVVTCGTSQLGARHLARLELGSLNRYLEITEKETPATATLRDELHSDSKRFSDLTGALLEKLRKPSDSSDKPIAEMTEAETTFLATSSNPFGAEISTLIRMQQQDLWTPEKDHVLLLSSPTEAGIWAATLIERALLDYWGLSAGQVTFKLVEGLYGTTAHPGDALGNLATILQEVLNDTEKQPVLVMTGGFKSIVPCLTIFSLIFGVPLVYLFEESAKLQLLNEQLDVGSLAPEELKKIWKRVDKKGMRLSVGVCLERALKGQPTDAPSPA